MSCRRGRGKRGGSFPGRGRGEKYESNAYIDSNLTLNLHVQLSSATQATHEVQHGNANVYRGRGSRGRSNYSRPSRGFQPHAGTSRGKTHGKSQGSFQPPKHPVVPCKDGDSVMKQQRRETNQHNSKQATTAINTSASSSKPDGKPASSYRGRQRGGKGNPNQGRPKQMDNSAKGGGGSGSQQSGAKKLDNMKKSVSCGICLEVWTRPKTLPCDHVFCEKCLEKVINRRRQVVMCPECRQEHTLPPQGLRNSWFTHRYLESLADDFKDLKT